MSEKDFAMKNPVLVAGVVVGGLALLYVAYKGGLKKAANAAGGAAVDVVVGVLSGVYDATLGNNFDKPINKFLDGLFNNTGAATDYTIQPNFGILPSSGSGW
jgi:hypothetical protein